MVIIRYAFSLLLLLFDYDSNDDDEYTNMTSAASCSFYSYSSLTFHLLLLPSLSHYTLISIYVGYDNVIDIERWPLINSFALESSNDDNRTATLGVDSNAVIGGNIGFTSTINTGISSIPTGKTRLLLLCSYSCDDDGDEYINLCLCNPASCCFLFIYSSLSISFLHYTYTYLLWLCSRIRINHP